MFQAISILVLLGTFIGVIIHWFAFPTSKECAGGGGPIRGMIHLFCLLLVEQRLSVLGALKKLCYLVTFACFVVLAFTGFWPLLVRGEHIGGYLMMIHATFAPVFAICLAIMAITWASRHRFVQGDCPWVRRLLRTVTSLHLEPMEGRCNWTSIGQKVTFWAIVALSLPLILSIVLSMLPLFGTHWQELALAAHRWTAVIFAVAAIVHAYLAVRIRIVQ
jgi:cytochrome b subunit of formate dehydrogenase